MRISIKRSIWTGRNTLLVMVFLTGRLHGQATLSLDEVVREVLTNNPSLKAVSENWQAMKEGDSPGSCLGNTTPALALIREWPDSSASRQIPSPMKS